MKWKEHCRRDPIDISDHLGSDASNDRWSNTYNQQLYSDLTGTIRELTSNDDDDDTDTRFQPPLEGNNKKIQPIAAEGYQLASSELISPVISVPLNKESPHERLRRDASSDNSSTPANSLQTVVSVNPETVSTMLSNNTSDNDFIISDADADVWARSLLLSTSMDGSGSDTDSKFLLWWFNERVNKL